MRSDLKRTLLDIFTKNRNLDIELKVSNLDVKLVPLIALMYEEYKLELELYKDEDKTLMHPFLHAILSGYRSVAGKGSEQLLNMLYPRSEQYLILNEEQRSETPETRKKGFFSRLFNRRR